MPVTASTAKLPVHCPTCRSTNVGAAWTRDGELHMIVCHACKAVWTPSPAARPAAALEAAPAAPA